MLTFFGKRVSVIHSALHDAAYVAAPYARIAGGARYSPPSLLAFSMTSEELPGR